MNPETFVKDSIILPKWPNFPKFGVTGIVSNGKKVLLHWFLLVSASA